MAVLRIYTGDDGQTHFQDLPNAFPRIGKGEVSRLQPTTDVVQREDAGNSFGDWHNAPRRQYVIVLSGEIEIEIGDGSKRRLVTGDVLLAEDVSGQGHITRGFGDRRTMSIGLA